MDKLNRAIFFASVRLSLFGNHMTTAQVAGIDAIIDEWERQQLTDHRWLAYMLATAYWESAQTMQPIQEHGKGNGKDYGKKLKMGGGPGHRIPYTQPDKLYYGRGLVQITWYENYEMMGKALKIDLLNHPELALDMRIAIRILFEGMLNGDFTGKSLEDYFNSCKEDWVNARRIINGIDESETIAHIAKKFYSAVIVSA